MRMLTGTRTPFKKLLTQYLAYSAIFLWQFSSQSYMLH
jgi:hypothetical protein